MPAVVPEEVKELGRNLLKTLEENSGKIILALVCIAGLISCFYSGGATVPAYAVFLLWVLTNSNEINNYETDSSECLIS